MNLGPTYLKINLHLKKKIKTFICSTPHSKQINFQNLKLMTLTESSKCL